MGIGDALRSPLVRKLALAFVLSTGGATAIIQHEGSPKAPAVNPATHEGKLNVAYVDPVGIVTICAGHTRTAKLGQLKTDDECLGLLKEDTRWSERGVKAAIKVPITQDQYDALTSFAFNVGNAGLLNSTLARKLNAGDCRGAAAEFPRWNRAGGRILRGLTKRRLAERTTFEKDCP